MATPSPRLSPKSTTMNIAVVGLTSSSQGDQGEGSGKSCLCNKFIIPHSDYYYHNHPYIVNLSEFGNSVINNCHFLYWGEKVTALEDGSGVNFRVIEHTEFVEDMSLKPFSAQKPYHKRIIVTKLQSGGKLQYVAPNQLTLPEDYQDAKRFPDRAIVIDGFVICVDVSCDYTPDSHYKTDTLKLISIVQNAKKPIVIALTKCDRVSATKIIEVNEFLSKIKRSPQTIEVSSHEGVNIDLCFLVLAHLIDSHKPRARITPFEESHILVKERKNKNEKLFKAMLEKKLTDFTVPKTKAVLSVKNEPEWEGVAQLLGSQRCERLVNIKLGNLHIEAVMKQTEMFKEMLPKYLLNVIPHVTLQDNVDSCLDSIKNNEKFEDYFVHIDNWTEFLNTLSNRIPYSFIEKEGKNFIQEHINTLKLEIKREQAITKIRETLQNTQDLQPGVKAKVAMETLGLKEEADMLEPDVLQKLYQERMNVVEQKCAEDIHELLLERLDLFHAYTPDPKEITEKLMDEPRMKKMELAVTRRNGIIVKHISTLEVLNRGPYYTPEILEILETDTPSLETLQDTMTGQWNSENESDMFNLVIISSNSEETVILKSDIMNQCTGADVYDYNDKSYQLRMKCCHGDNEDMTTEKYIPHGAIVILSSLESLEWIGSYINNKFIDKSSPYRGMPLVMLVITPDLTNESNLLNQSKQLAANLQCVLVSTNPTELPGRLIPPEIVNSLLPSLFDNVMVTHSFIFDGPVRELEGLNFGVFCLPGDPNVAAHLKSVINSSQLVHYSDKDRIVYTKTALERQHKIVALSIYSTINAQDFGSYPVLGFVIFYSTDRKASLSAVKWLIPRLHPIPILLVAVCTNNSSPLIEEGRSFAKERGDKVEFVVCHSHLAVSRLNKFYSNCFFSRFTSWRNQGLSEEISAKILKRRANNLSRPLPLPNGDYQTVQTLPHSLSRHSVAFGDYDKSSPPIIPNRFSTISVRNKTKKPISVAITLSDDELDDSLYSDPTELINKFKATNNDPTKYKSTPEISNTIIPVSPREHYNTLPHTLSEYAMVPDSNTIGKLDTLTRNRKSKKDQHRSVSESPQHVSNDSLYSPVREQGPLVKRKISKDGNLSPPHHPPPSSIPFVYPKATLYDHLTPRSRRKMIQEQMGSTRNSFDTEGVYSFAGDVPVTTRPPLPSNSSPHYSSFNNTQIQLGQLQNELNFVAEGLDQAGNYSSLDRRSQSPTAIYDFCENPEPQTSPASNRSLPKQLSLQSYNVKTVDGSPSPQRRPHPPYIRPDYSSLPPTPSDSIGQYDYASIPNTTRYSIQTQSHEGTPEAIYSLADESPSIPLPKPITPPRQSPLMIKRNATPPPPIHPKTSSFSDGAGYWSNQIKPTTKSKSASQRTTPSTTPILSRAIEHVTPSEDNPDLIYAIPDKIRKPFPKIQHTASIDNPDVIYALPDMSRKRETTPILIDDDDEAPPLPPRNYDTSDIEDDDEELLHSDDDDDRVFQPVSSSVGVYSSVGVSSSVGVYACVGEVIDDESTLQSNKDSSVIEQIESIYMNLNLLRKQRLHQQQQQITTTTKQDYYEESIYDSLEKVIEDVNKGTVPKPKETTHPANGAVALPMSKMPTGPATMPTLSVKAIKLLKKIEKKSKKEREKRLKQEGKRKKKEEKRKKAEKNMKKGKKIKQSTRKRYFESPLASIVDEDGIPSFIKTSIAIIERDGLDSVGLYRISGKREDILTIQEKYDQDPNMDIDSLGVCVNAITGTLKSFFKVLPDPLIPETLLTPLLDIPGGDNIDIQIKNMVTILSLLPRENLKTLQFLCAHLNKVQQNHELNKMNASNLSIVFWPTLMRPPLMDMADPTKQLGWQLAMSKLIEYPNCIPIVD